MSEMWDSGLWDKVIYPIGDEAIEKYGDEIRQTDSIKGEVQGYEVELVNNPVILEGLFKFLFPECAGTECQVNIYIRKDGKTYVPIYQYIDGKWRKDKS
jgi:hypothetical protein